MWQIKLHQFDGLQQDSYLLLYSIAGVLVCSRTTFTTDTCQMLLSFLLTYINLDWP